jgi:hypothetical protein
MTSKQKLKYSVAAGLFVATFSLSGYWIVTNPQQPLPDPTLYEGIGANLALGNGYSFDISPPYRPEITRMPFLPVLISILYQFTGRSPQAVLWMNAVWIGLAVALGYLLALRIFENQAVAITGGLIAFLTPPVTGAANNILTEPVAMLQLTGAAWLVLDWPKRFFARLAPLHAGLLGLLLASLVLNRAAMTPIALAVGAYVCWTTLKTRWRLLPAWITVGVFSVLLGAPVLAWSARNALVGLSFSPAPVGLYASRVFDMKRHREHLLEEGERLPRVNRQYFLHWKKHYGPDELIELDRKNREWFEKWRSEHGDRIIASMPARFITLFSFFRNSIFPPWPLHKNQQNREKMRWVSRTLWSLSLLGLIVSWRNRRARYIWLVPIVSLVVMHVPTVCHARYMFPLMPLLMPYGGVALVWGWRKTVGRLIARRNSNSGEPRSS